MAENNENKFLLEVKDLHTFFTTRRGIVKAVNNTSYSVKEGETLGIVGESGSGKSVTMLSVMKLLPDYAKITADKIEFDGED
ncbi:MAG: ATP-binding cassette domain-containing protein, partial [Clostridia bacterium]|nr:ATP-binding cassette domain-containing protein [Clostridia bacterium]